MTMLSLVRYSLYGLAALANVCGADGNPEYTSTTHASAIAVISTQTTAKTKNGTASVLSSSSTTTRTATCPSRTINYITHTLAQQCLRADWSRSRSTNSSVTTGSPSPVTANITESTSVSLVSGDSTPIDPSSTSLEPSSSSTIIVQATVALDSKTDSDAESALDNANFLSFEDWKKQNLAKAGQSGDNIGTKQQFEPGRRPANVNALDSLGEESEIDLDFSGFGGASVKPETSREQSTNDHTATTENSDISQVSPASQALRPKDAGKTCKERTNYASFDCAATVLKSNKECKSASSVLVENKDSYMLNKCSADNKYFIIELCNDILIDTVVLANYEFFSSIFRTFRVSVSDRYPAKAEKWKNLGTFEARNTREVQAFLIENPLIWARYLRIEFLTHYGSEYYCPVSLLRVHGTTMMEEFRNQEELSRGETQDDDAVIETVDAVALNTMAPSAIQSVESVVSDKPSATDQVEVVYKTTSSVSDVPISLETRATDTSATSTTTLLQDIVADISTMGSVSSAKTTHLSDSSTAVAQSQIDAAHSPSDKSGTAVASSTPTSEQPYSSSVRSSSASSTISTVEPESTLLTTAVVGAQSTSITMASSSKTPSHATGNQANPSQISSTTTDTVSKPSISSTVKDSPHKSTSNSTKSATSSSQQAQPSTQESIFKSISKRLQQLESNSTLSLQYIEEQSRILRDAFSKVEKRQISTTTSFLANLNSTVMAELTGFRQAYDQLWQSTVIELEGQQEQHQREMTALSSRLTLVVDELVWQKRMGIVQSTLLLLCLGLVLFVRPGNGSLEASLAQQVMARSQAAFRSGTASNQNSPASGRSPVSLFRRKLPLWRNSPKQTDLQDDASLSPAPESPDGIDSPVDDMYDDEDDRALSEPSLDTASI